jgi:hypothetical protein
VGGGEDEKDKVGLKSHVNGKQEQAGRGDIKVDKGGEGVIQEAKNRSIRVKRYREERVTGQPIAVLRL